MAQPPPGALGFEQALNLPLPANGVPMSNHVLAIPNPPGNKYGVSGTNNLAGVGPRQRDRFDGWTITSSWCQYRYVGCLTGLAQYGEYNLIQIL